MKKTMITAAGLLFAAGSLAAQARPAPKAPAPPAPVAAPAPEPEKKSDQGSTGQLVIWGGYNFSSSTSFETLDNTVKELDSNFTTKSSSTITKGGIAGGADFLLGSGLQYGLGVAYLQVYKLTWANSTSAERASLDANIAYLPMHLQLQYNIMGFKIGAGAGISLGFGDVKTVLSGFGAGTDTNTTTKVKGSALSASVMIGYGLSFGNVNVDLGVRYYAVFDDKVVNNIVPNAAVGFKF